MTDKFTIKIPREDGERHNERRQELGLTWLEYIDAQGDEWTLKQGVDVNTLAQRLASHTEDLGNGAGVEAIARKVSKELDYVELSNRVADELEERMQ